MNDTILIHEDHLKLWFPAGHWAELPPGGVLPVARHLLHCLHKSTPQFLHLNEEEDPQPGDHLHI